MAKEKAIMNWSGGKDSSLCLHRVLQSDKYDITYLFTTLNQEFNRISQHGVRADLLDKQSEKIGIPVIKLYLPDKPTMESYNRMMKEALSELKGEQITTSLFGDIFLEDLRQYREERLSEIGFQACFPLWKQETSGLAIEFIESGFKAVVVCVDERYLDKSFVGREYDQSFLHDLPSGVDPCGENGEFHTYVYDGPIYNQPIRFSKGEIVYRTYIRPEKSDDAEGYTCGENDHQPHPGTGFWYLDLIPPTPINKKIRG
ncbi:MAG: diphthine--ammonia ligase [Balneolaceae bacterium]